MHTWIVGGVWLVDWCTRRPTCRALKRGVVPHCTRGRSTRGMGGVRLVDWCICGPTHRALKTRSRSELIFFNNKKYWCFYLHRLRDSVSPASGNFTKPVVYYRLILLLHATPFFSKAPERCVKEDRFPMHCIALQ